MGIQMDHDLALAVVAFEKRTAGAPVRGLVLQVVVLLHDQERPDPRKAAAEEIIGKLQVLFGCHNVGATLSAKAVFKRTNECHNAPPDIRCIRRRRTSRSMKLCPSRGT